MAVNGIGSKITIAANTTGVAIPNIENNQYQPVPWNAELLVLARVSPTNAGDAGASAAFNLNSMAIEIARGVNIPDGEFSPVYSQVIVATIKQGNRWDIRIDNTSGISVDVELTAYLYHEDPNETSMGPRPTRFV